MQIAQVIWMLQDLREGQKGGMSKAALKGEHWLTAKDLRLQSERGW